MSFMSVLFLIFLVLKLTGFIAWSWIWVTAPLWIGAVIWVILFTLVVTGVIKFGHHHRRGMF